MYTAVMGDKDTEDICRKIDNVLDTYFDELLDCIERKKDMQSLRGWLRMSLHEAVVKTQRGREAARNKIFIAIMVISVINTILLFFRYIVDPI